LHAEALDVVALLTGMQEMLAHTLGATVGLPLKWAGQEPGSVHVRARRFRRARFATPGHVTSLRNMAAEDDGFECDAASEDVCQPSWTANRGWVLLSRAPCPTLARQLALQRGQRTFQRFAQNPVLLLGDGIKGIDRLLRRLDVELHVPARAMSAWSALGSGDCRWGWLPAVETCRLGHGSDLLRHRCRLIATCFRCKTADVDLVIIRKDAGARFGHLRPLPPLHRLALWPSAARPLRRRRRGRLLVPP
jgi:hypothetical protein